MLAPNVDWHHVPLGTGSVSPVEVNLAGYKELPSPAVKIQGRLCLSCACLTDQYGIDTSFPVLLCCCTPHSCSKSPYSCFYLISPTWSSSGWYCTNAHAEAIRTRDTEEAKPYWPPSAVVSLRLSEPQRLCAIPAREPGNKSANCLSPTVDLRPRFLLRYRFRHWELWLLFNLLLDFRLITLTAILRSGQLQLFRYNLLRRNKHSGLQQLQPTSRRLVENPNPVQCAATNSPLVPLPPTVTEPSIPTAIHTSQAPPAQVFSTVAPLPECFSCPTPSRLQTSPR